MIQKNDVKLLKQQKILTVLPPIILILSNLFFFGPFTIYQGNTSEFGIAFLTIISSFLLPSLIFTCIVTLIATMLPDRLHKCLVAFLFVGGILLWLQGNVLLWDYGVFGKGAIDWTKDIWRGWTDTTVWIVLLTSSLFFYKRVYKISTSTSMVFFLLQALLMVYGSVERPEVWKKGADLRPPEEIYQFSTKQNVIHIILDELQSDVFRQIIEEDPERYSKVFEGFTFFKENTGSFPTTIMSIPVFLSGKTYKNDIPIEIFTDTVYKGKTIPNVLFDHGYEVDLAAEQTWYATNKHTNWYRIPVPYGVATDVHEQANFAHMMTLTFFRHAPHFAKIVINETRLSMPMTNFKDKIDYEALRHFSHKAFLQDLIDNMSVKRDKPLYKLIHLTTTHWPTVLNQDCGDAGAILPFNWNNIKNQARCSLDHFIQYLEKLKTLGVYDSALIIVNADHGYWKVDSSRYEVSLQNLDKELVKDFHDEEDFAKKVCASVPLLAIKPPHSMGGLKTSNAQTMNADIPATVTSLLGLSESFGGRSIMDIDTNETRDRKFYYYYDINNSGDKYFHRIDEYLIRGRARDRESWSFVSLDLPPGVLRAIKKIIFGSDETTQFLRYGWSVNETDPEKPELKCNWTIGDSAGIYLPVPKKRSRLTAHVRTFFPQNAQAVSVFINGKKAGSWRNSKQWEWESRSIILQPDEDRPNVSRVRFVFSDHRIPDEKDSRPLAVLFESITIEEVEK